MKYKNLIIIAMVFLIGSMALSVGYGYWTDRMQVDGKATVMIHATINHDITPTPTPKPTPTPTPAPEIKAKEPDVIKESELKTTAEEAGQKTSGEVGITSALPGTDKANESYEVTADSQVIPNPQESMDNSVVLPDTGGILENNSSESGDIASEPGTLPEGAVSDSGNTTPDVSQGTENPAADASSGTETSAADISSGAEAPAADISSGTGTVGDTSSSSTGNDINTANGLTESSSSGNIEGSSSISDSENTSTESEN